MKFTFKEFLEAIIYLLTATVITLIGVSGFMWFYALGFKGLAVVICVLLILLVVHRVLYKGKGGK